MDTTLSNNKICIIEDEIPLLELYKEHFEVQGFDVVTATDGNEGWEVIKRERPAIVISDNMMPGMDGLTLCKKIKQDVNVSYVYFILLTAWGGTDMKINALKSGADRYLSKPITLKELHAEVISFIRRKELHDAIMKKLVSQMDSEKATVPQLTKTLQRGSSKIPMVVKSVENIVSDLKDNFVRVTQVLIDMEDDIQELVHYGDVVEKIGSMLSDLMELTIDEADPVSQELSRKIEDEMKTKLGYSTTVDSLLKQFNRKVTSHNNNFQEVLKKIKLIDETSYERSFLDILLQDINKIFGDLLNYYGEEVDRTRVHLSESQNVPTFKFKDSNAWQEEISDLFDSNEMQDAQKGKQPSLDSKIEKVSDEDKISLIGKIDKRL